MFETSCYRTSGLNFVVSAIVLWSIFDLDRAVKAMRESGREIDVNLLIHVSPYGWEHFNLTRDYIWQQYIQILQGQFRPLRKELVS